VLAGGDWSDKMSISDERLAKNEILFRAVNERLDELGSIVPWSRKTEYLCECSDTSCIEAITLSKEEYEQVRARPTVFVVVAGHERPALERIVGDHGEYLLVEKTVAVDAVLETDPRSA
jgi:hypothetical protein